MFFVNHMGRKNIPMPVSRGLFWKFFLSFWLLVVSQIARADGIADAEVLYGNCLIVKKGTLLECRQLYLEYLDTFADELWGEFLKRHKIFLDKANLNGKNIIINDVKGAQKKWEEYDKYACVHLYDSMVFGTNGPNILFTECRALMTKQRIQLLRHIFCAGDDLESCAKKWKVEESTLSFNQKMTEIMQMNLAKDAEHMLELFRRESFYKGVEQYNKGDRDGAFKKFQPLAEQGDAAAQSFLSVMYFYGEGVQKDEHKAFEWLHKAAQQGNAYTQYALFGLYYEGVGVKQDRAKAEMWLRKAAAQGLPEAQETLAKLLGDSKGNAE